jgi:carboxymethylenebutenolidase
MCMAWMSAGAMAGHLDHYGAPALKAALGQLGDRPEVDATRLGAVGFCLGGSIVLTWACTAAGIPHDLKVYPGAKHSFFNDQWRNYHPAAAADSWQRVLAFFAGHVMAAQQR